MLKVDHQRRLGWALAVLLVVLAAAASAWYWFAVRPDPAPPGATLVWVAA